MTISTNIYSLLAPLAIFFVLAENGFSVYYRKNLISFAEAITNYGTAMGNQTVNVLVAAGVYLGYGYLWEHFRLINDLPTTWYCYLLLLLGIDFIFYWVHRLGHEINIMWATHSPHHSAQEMNFLVALRASVTQRLFSFFFFWPLTIIGFRPFDIYLMTAIHLLISFMNHTELIPKLWRWIEYVFTTPSHHRVHHGVNFKYLDKVYGEFLIVWDRLFGTYEEETDKVIYGMYGQLVTWNPIVINFHYCTLMWQDARKATRRWDKIRTWFMPLGWRPANLPPHPPKEEITAQNQRKIKTFSIPGSDHYLISGAVFGTILMLLVISPNSVLTTWERLMGSLLLWYLIVNWSGILEAKPWLFNSEMIRILITCGCLIVFYDLFQRPLWLAVCLLYHLYSFVSVALFYRPRGQF